MAVFLFPLALSWLSARDIYDYIDEKSPVSHRPRGLGYRSRIRLIGCVLEIGGSVGVGMLVSLTL